MVETTVKAISVVSANCHRLAVASCLKLPNGQKMAANSMSSTAQGNSRMSSCSKPRHNQWLSSGKPLGVPNHCAIARSRPDASHANNKKRLPTVHSKVRGGT